MGKTVLSITLALTETMTRGIATGCRSQETTAPDQSRRRIAHLLNERRSRSRRRRLVTGGVLVVVAAAGALLLLGMDLRRQAAQDAASSAIDTTAAEHAREEHISTVLMATERSGESSPSATATSTPAQAEPVVRVPDASSAPEPTEMHHAVAMRGVTPTETGKQEVQPPPVKWTDAMCLEVNQAVLLDYGRLLARLDQNLRQGKIRAADRRRGDALSASANAAGEAGTAAALGDEAEAERIMLGVYRVWNECRVTLDLAEVAYGSIPDDARKQIEADRAKWTAERDAALEWSDEACKRIDAAMEADAQLLTPVSRDALRSFVGGWRMSADVFSDAVLARDKRMREVYQQWDDHRASLKLAAVPYGQLPDGTILAKPRASIGR